MFFDFINEFVKNCSILAYLYIFFVGLCFGSFYNVVVYRYPVMYMLENLNNIVEYLKEELKINIDVSVIEKKIKEYPKGFSLSKPSSHCPKCNAKIKFYYNIPVIGYFITKMKCGSCGVKISPIYPMLELLTGIIVLSAFHFMIGNKFWIIFLFFVLITWAAALIDIKSLMLPDSINYVLIWSGLLATLNGFNFYNITIEQSIYGILVGFFLPFTINFIGKLIKGFDVIGAGDFKLLAGIGAFLGIKGAIFTFFVAPFLGIITWLVFLIYNKLNNVDQENQSMIPFGPSLIFTSWIFPIYGDTILSLIIQR